MRVSIHLAPNIPIYRGTYLPSNCSLYLYFDSTIEYDDRKKGKKTASETKSNQIKNEKSSVSL